MTRAERSNKVTFEGTPAPLQTMGSQPAATQATGSHNGMDDC